METSIALSSGQPWPVEWADDWFMVGDTGVVEGPMAAADVFSHEGDSTSRFVSRRGFAQWYDARDFAGLWHSSNQLAQVLAHHVNLQPEPLPTGSEMVVADVDAPTESMVDDEILRAFSATGVDPAALAAPVALQPAAFVEPKVEMEDPRNRWLSRRGSQRLGKLTNPVIPALLSILTFGFGHVAWLLGSLREVVWHLDHDANVNRYVRHAWMAWVPGLHLKVTWDLACLIRAMEEQDGYTSTSPLVAVMLGFCPPFSAMYLQHALNDHWLIHCIV